MRLPEEKNLCLCVVGWSRAKFRASVGVDCLDPCPPSVAPP